VLFFLAGIGAITGAVGVVALRNPFYNVLALVAHLISLAVLFLLLRAEFVAAVQVVVYAGAVMVLYVFVVAYVGGEGEAIGERLRSNGSRPPAIGSGLRLAGALVGGALLVELLIALLGTGLEATRGYGAPYVPGPRTFGTPAYIGNLLLTRFLLVFELASFLLLIAAVGGVVLARRRGGLEEEDESDRLTPLELLRPLGTGTTAEGVGNARGRARPTGAEQLAEPAVKTGAGQR
ncbi:MAG: NADH-quinone oxidoreductase subunit J family protein, partial [Solirubrobacteraceae bacterium]